MSKIDLIYEDLDKIREAIKSTGFLFEQRMATKLEELGFLVNTNVAFPDEDNNTSSVKSRETDIVAKKVIIGVPNSDSRFFCRLICECKDSSNPLVFITRRKNKKIKVSSPLPNGLIFYSPEILLKYQDKQELDRVSFYDYFEIGKKYFATRDDFEARQISKIARKGTELEAQNSGVLEGYFYPLTKAQKYMGGQDVNQFPRNDYMKMHLNLVITNSTLYSVASEDESLQLKEKKFVPFFRDIKNDILQGKYLITFVNAKYLEDFVRNEVEKFCNDILELYVQHPDLRSRRLVAAKS